MTKFDLTADIIKKNINFLMDKHSISGFSALARNLDVPATTIYSFLRNPLSNSKVKFKICNYFNVSIEELESCDLQEYEIETSDKSDINSSLSILSMSDDTISNFLKSSKTNNNDIDELKHSIATLISTNFRKCCGQAKINFKAENYQKALYYISSAFWLLKPTEIKYITENDLSLYVDIANYFNDNDLINTLIIKLESADYFNYKIILVFANLLEDKFPQEAKMCYEIIKDKEFKTL